jgi:outer membrane receptor protein involved in Fe transport
VWAPGVSDLREETTEWALFTHNIYSIREGLDLTFGLRYSDVEKESTKGQMVGEWGAFKDFAHPLVPTTPWGANIPTRKDSWNEVTGTIKMTWWLSDEISVYGGWDRGFKAGGHDVCKGSDPEPYCPEPFDSELADNFEVGLKGRFLDNTLVFNTAAYYQTYDDYQVFFPDGDPAVVAPSYSVFNASFGLTGAEGNWDAIIWVKNLADEEYIEAGSRNRDANQVPDIAGPASEGYRVNAGLERTYGLTLKYRFEQLL